jgi:hypothetical protein
VNKSIPRQYQSAGMMSLLASQQSTKGTSTLPGTGNPFLNFDSSLNDTADFLVRRLGSTDAAQQLATEGVGSYTAVLAASQGPFIDLTANGSTPDAAKSAMATLITYTSAQLKTLQEQQGVPEPNMITSAVIVPGGPPVAQSKRRVQDTLGAAAGGLALAFLVTFATDSFAARRRRRRARRPAGEHMAQRPTDWSEPAAGPGGERTPDPAGQPAALNGERTAEPDQEPAVERTTELIGPLSEARD